MPNEYFHLAQIARTNSRVANLLPAALVAISIFATPRPVQALLVGVTPGIVPDTSIDPRSAAFDSYWGTEVIQGNTVSKGPTGWANVGKNGNLNGVYIGD